MATNEEVERAALSELHAIKIGVAANFLTSPLLASLRHWTGSLNISSSPRVAPHDSIIQQLLDETGVYAEADLAVILVRLDTGGYLDTSLDPGEAFRNVETLVQSIRMAAARQPGTTFLTISCPPSPAASSEQTLLKMEEQLRGACAEFQNAHFISASDMRRYYPPVSYDAYFVRGPADEPGLHYSPLCYATMGTLVARRLRALVEQPRKCIVVDCDNTLWSGVCGEQGPLGVRVEAGNRRLQEVLLEQRRNGRLLCISSKNDEEDVMAVFERHPDMLLKREHLSALRINWNPKAQNLASLAKELNLDLSSFIFIDDDMFECQSIAALYPEVCTVRIAVADETAVTRTLLDVWELDTAALTAEDALRASYYRSELERDDARKAAYTLEQFLDSLELKVAIVPLTPDGVVRAAQLTQRVNQFNLNGIRRTAGELHARPSWKMCSLISASDRFGDYGVVGLLIYEKHDHCLWVETILLSCRALGRGVERRLAAHLAQEAQRSGVTSLNFEFIETKKNGPMRDFLSRIGVVDFSGENCVVHVDDVLDAWRARRL